MGYLTRLVDSGVPDFDPYPPALASCRACPRLVAHREAVAAHPRRAYAAGEPYWGAPVPGFGDPQATLVIVGLAPGAHGSNRTGRMFTGDASGDFLYPALHRAGVADRPHARHRDDGLTLRGVWITAVARCVPPGNAPTPSELAACAGWLAHDLSHLPQAQVLLALGAVAHGALLRHYRARGLSLRLSAHRFAHGAAHDLRKLPGASASGALPLVDAYHVSRQNTNTGRLTAAMFDRALATALAFTGSDAPERV
jgi:uracil-DNA glycosylase